MLTAEEQTALDKAADFVLAFKGKGLTSDEAMTMTVKLLDVFMRSPAGQQALLQRTTRATP
jgi:hypothetical protein